MFTCCTQNTAPKRIPCFSWIPCKEIIDVNRIKCPQDTTVIFDKIVYPIARKRTKPYEQSRSYKKPHFTCSILLYTEQNNKEGNRNHHHFICIIKEKEETINSTTKVTTNMHSITILPINRLTDYLNLLNARTKYQNFPYPAKHIKFQSPKRRTKAKFRQSYIRK